MVFVDKVYTIEEIKKALTPIFQKNEIILKVDLYGSYARGDAEAHADVNLLLKTDGVMELESFYEFMRDMHHALQVKIDVVFEEYINPVMMDNIKKEAILLYEK